MKKNAGLIIGMLIGLLLVCLALAVFGQDAVKSGIEVRLLGVNVHDMNDSPGRKDAVFITAFCNTNDQPVDSIFGTALFYRNEDMMAVSDFSVEEKMVAGKTVYKKLVFGFSVNRDIVTNRERLMRNIEISQLKVEDLTVKIGFIQVYFSDGRITEL